MKEYIQSNMKTYDKLAKEYAFRRDHIGKYSESTEYLGYAAFKHVPQPHACKVLEIGPGAGQIIKYYEDNGCRTVAVEVSKEMCKLCREQSPQSIIINDDICEMKFWPEQFDLIYMGAIIHLFTLNDAKALMLKVWTWLKDDGIVFVNTTCHEESIEVFSEKKDYNTHTKRFRRYWNEKEFEQFVMNSGFIIIEKLYTNEVDRNKRWVALIGKKDPIRNHN